MFALWLWLVAVLGLVLDPDKLLEAQEHIQLFRSVLAKQAMEKETEQLGDWNTNDWEEPITETLIIQYSTTMESPTITMEHATKTTYSISTTNLMRKPFKLKIGAPPYAFPTKDSKAKEASLPEIETEPELKDTEINEPDHKETEKILENKELEKVVTNKDTEKEEPKDKTPIENTTHKIIITSPHYDNAPPFTYSDTPDSVTVPPIVTVEEGSSDQQVTVEVPVDRRVSHGLNDLLQNQRQNRSVFELEPLFQEGPNSSQIERTKTIETNNTDIKDTHASDTETSPSLIHLEESISETKIEAAPEYRRSNLRSVLESGSLPKSFHKSYKPEPVETYPEPTQAVPKISYKDLFDLNPIADNVIKEAEKKKPQEEDPSPPKPDAPRLESEDVDKLLKALVKQDDFKHILNNMDDKIKDYVNAIAPQAIQPDSKEKVAETSLQELLKQHRAHEQSKKESHKNTAKPEVERQPRKQHQAPQEMGWFQKFTLKLFGPKGNQQSKRSASTPQANDAASQPETYPSIVGVVIFVMYAIFL